ARVPARGAGSGAAGAGDRQAPRDQPARVLQGGGQGARRSRAADRAARAAAAFAMAETRCVAEARVARAAVLVRDFVHLADQHGLTAEFPPAVHADVDAFLAAPGLDDPELANLDAIPFVTIDGAGTRDL